MLNHARTLLLNYRGPHAEQLDVPGDVYIPQFEPIELSPELSQIHALLFGTAFDYYGLVYRAAQYMGILNSTEYAPYVYEQDPRITYDPDQLGLAAEAIFSTVITGPAGLHVNGAWADAGGMGRIATLWRVTTLSTNTVRVDNVTSHTSIDYTASDVKTLIGSDLVFTIDAQPYTPATRWYVLNKSRPVPELAGILTALKALPDSTRHAVFEDAHKEPYKTFYNLFQDHYAFPYQLSGFLFAFIRRLEDIRKHVI